MKYYPLSGIHLSGGLTRQTWRIMKLTFIMITAFLMQVSASTMAQQLTLKENRITLKNVFTEIRKQTGYIVLYQAEELDATKTVSVNLDHVSLKEAMTKILQNLDLDFTIEDQSIVIKKKEISFIYNLKNKIKAELAQVIVAGKVLNELGEPMAGVTVRIKDTQQATVTDKSGSFAISVPQSETILVFSFIGFESQEFRAKDITTGGIITLKASQTNLHEVVINKGYYNERQELSTGNVSKVTAKEIEEQPVSNVLEALQGRVPGLVITQTTGLPGGGYNVQIRGQNSIANGNDPFYVIDGVPYDSQIPAAIGGKLLNASLHGGNPLNYINPYDIESIEVLKDADATAIYGSRAANGAILITTKKGQAGALKIDLNVNSGFTDPARVLPLMNTQQYLAMRNEAFKNDGKTPFPNSDYDLTFWDTNRYTDWSKVLTRNTAPFTDANLAISGGNTNTQWLLGGGYRRQTAGFPTLIPNQGADQQGSAHFSMNTMSDDKKFTLNFTASYLSDVNTVQIYDYTNPALSFAPDAPPLYSPDGSLNWAPKAPGLRGTWVNPLAQNNQTYNSKTSNLVTNAVIGYKLLPGLELKTSLGYTNMQVDETHAKPTTINDPASNVASGTAEFNATNSNSWIIEPQAAYTIKVGKGTFAATLGGSFQNKGTHGQYLNASGFLNDALLEDAQAASSIYVNSTSSQYKYEGIYGRLNYNWDDKYLLNLTARRDGSSRFGPGKQYGNFGALGAGWIFSKEKLIEDNLPFLSFGKIRGSYGSTGNDQIGDYQFLDTYTPTGLPYDGSLGLFPQNLFNPNLAWEIDKKLEGGVELGFFKDRITLQTNFYRNRSNNQLTGIPLSLVTGFSGIAANFPATVQNSGQEYELHTVNIKTNSFSWSTSFNISFNQNKLLAYPNFSTSGYQNALVIGQPLSIIKVYHFLGVNPLTGIYQFEDHNGNPTSKPDINTDRNTLINATPKFFGGFQNSLSYKGFSLDFFFQFVKQIGKNINGLYRAMPGTMNNQPSDILGNEWQKPGDSKAYEMFSQNFSGAAYKAVGYAQQSDWIYSDASYIRLKNVALSWNLPQNWKQSLHLKSARIYIQGQNLLTFTNYKGLDPETQSIGAPPKKVMTAGVQASF